MNEKRLKSWWFIYTFGQNININAVDCLFVCTHKYMNAVCVDDTHKYSAHQAGPESSVHEWVWHRHDAWAQAAFDDMEQSTDWSIWSRNIYVSWWIATTLYFLIFSIFVSMLLLGKNTLFTNNNNNLLLQPNNENL